MKSASSQILLMLCVTNILAADELPVPDMAPLLNMAKNRVLATFPDTLSNALVPCGRRYEYEMQPQDRAGTEVCSFRFRVPSSVVRTENEEGTLVPQQA